MKAVRGIISSLILGASIFLLPTYLYSQSAESIGLPLTDFLLIAVVWTLTASAVALLVLAAMRFSPWPIAVVAGVGLAIALKFLVLPSPVPILDGDEQFAPAFSLAGLFSIAVLVVLIPAAVCAAKRISTLALGCALLAMLAMAIAPTFFTRQKPFSADAFAQQSNDFFSLSNRGNVIVVLLDAMPSDIFAQIAAEDAHVHDAMPGFTLFANSTSSAPTTLINMMAVYSGRQYDGGSIKANYRAAAADGVFTDARAAGMNTAISGFTPYVCPAERCFPIEEMTGFTPFHASLASFVNLAQVAHLRTVPTALQGWLYNSGAGQLTMFSAPQGHVDQSVAALRNAATTVRAQAMPKPTFRFFHIFVTHPPVSVNEQCEDIGQQESTRTLYKAQASCGVHAFVALLNAMRAQGLYDSSTIVLMSDHGVQTYPSASESPTLLPGVRMFASRPQRFVPTFAVKPANAHGPLAVNTAPTINADLRATLCAIAFHCDHPVPGHNAFAAADPNRQRRFRDFAFTMTQLMHRDILPANGSKEYTIGGNLSELNRLVGGGAPHASDNAD